MNRKTKAIKNTKKAEKRKAVEFVHFHNAQFEKHGARTLKDCYVATLTGDRKIQVCQLAGEDGYAIQIFKPTVDGKVSKLSFGLTPDAAQALAVCLCKQLEAREK